MRGEATDCGRSSVLEESWAVKTLLTANGSRLNEEEKLAL